MDFNLTKEQELLRDGLARFLSTRYDLEKSRAAAKTGHGWQPDIWRGFADELGILGASLPEDVGGIGGGPVEVMVIAEALGHALVVEPYVDTVVVAGGLLRRAGGEAAAAVLEKIVAGTAIVALAAAEPTSGDDWQDVSTTAQPDGDDWILHGSKIVAMSVPLATHLLISARTADGISLFLVDVDSAGPGLEIHSYRTIDDRRAADLVIDGLRLPAPRCSAARGKRGRPARRATKAPRRSARKRLVHAQVPVRHRRAQPIGSFQVLQHRMVDMYMELEQAVAAVHLAVLHLESEPVTRARSVSSAKATIGRAARFIGQNAVQLHGGMGMTEELAVATTSNG